MTSNKPLKVLKTHYNQLISTLENDIITNEIVKKGVYDKYTLQLIENILKRIEKPICLDIGTNIGNHAIVMALFSEKVYLFEPNLKLIPLIKYTLALNQLENCHLSAFGLSDQNQTRILHENTQGNVGASTLVAEMTDAAHTSKQTVELKIGDEVIATEHIEKVDLIKIDVEGFETNVFLGLQSTLKKHRPIVIMELNEFTKKKFTEENILETIFTNYDCMTISNNYAAYLVKYPLLRKLTRKIYSAFNQKRVTLLPFDNTLAYSNVVFFPKEKQRLITN